MNVWSGLRVDASGDHQRRERVAAFVEGHGFEPACSPGALGALRDGRRAERCAVGEAEHQRTLVLVLCDPMLDEVIAEYRRDRRAAKAGRRLRLDRALLLIPRALDADQAGCEVDAVPGERLQLATPQAGVEGGGPERAIFGRRVVDERQGLNRGRDPGAAATPSPPALTPLQPECSSPVPAPAPGSEGPARRCHQLSRAGLPERNMWRAGSPARLSTIRSSKSPVFRGLGRARVFTKVFAVDEQFGEHFGEQPTRPGAAGFLRRRPLPRPRPRLPSGDMRSQVGQELRSLAFGAARNCRQLQSAVLGCFVERLLRGSGPCYPPAGGVARPIGRWSFLDIRGAASRLCGPCSAVE